MVVPGLQNKGSATRENRVHTPIGNITPENRMFGGSLNDARRPIDVLVWQKENLEANRQNSFPNIQNKQEKEPLEEQIHHTV